MIKILRFVQDLKGSRVGYLYAESEIAFYRRLTLFEKGGRRWVQFASENTQKKNEKGYDIYEPFWELKDRKKMQAFYDAVLTALDEWLAAGNVAEEQPKKEAPRKLFHDGEDTPF